LLGLQGHTGQEEEHGLMGKARDKGMSPKATLRWSIRALTAVAWSSMAIFALYIAAFFGGQMLADKPEGWNQALSDLFKPNQPLRNLSIGAHFATGIVLLLLGPLQFIEVIRKKATWFHRTIGSLYSGAAILAGMGGLAFIVLGGTVGGIVMSIGFAGYGLAMAVCGVMTPFAAIRQRFDAHRAWVIRLFSLAIASWLYRMEYGFLFALLDGAGHQSDFRGTVDYVMAFAFYLPNLIVAEVIIRRPLGTWPVAAQRGLALILALLTTLLAVGSAFFVLEIWWPEILTHGPALLGRD